jgi:release factor glutamine methyltransferase
VNPSTLIPRPETEELVELILTGCRGRHSLSLLDIGTGSGCIACTLAKLLPGLQATGMDISGEALETARRNARSLALDTVAFIQADILSNVEAERKITESFDLIVANPPYVLESEKAAMESNVLNYEPHIALFVPGGDPLVFHRHIARFGRRRLKPGGELYMEINALLGNETVEFLRREGYAPVELLTDISGKDRIVKARLL